MIERKTAEIKFRVTPSSKSAWQAQAEKEQVGLSELLHRAMERELQSAVLGDTAKAITPAEVDDLFSDEAQWIDGTKLINNAIRLLADENASFTFVPSYELDYEVDPHGDKQVEFTPEPKPWMFEGRNA